MAQQRTDTGSVSRRASSAASRTARRQARRSRTTSAAADEGREVASTAADEGREVASAAADEGREVARAAARDARGLAGTAKEQATEVADELVSQGQGLMEETRGQLLEQAQTQASRLAAAMRQYGEQAEALADGRPSQAGPMPDYLRQASDRLEELAERVEERGPEGLLEDLQGFARRRPGAFLLGAAVAGFGIGRLVRAGGSGGDDGAGGR